MAIKVKERFENKNSKGIVHKSENKEKKIKQTIIITENLKDIIRDHERFNKENFYSLDLTHLNIYVNKGLKSSEQYAVIIKNLDIVRYLWIGERQIRIYYLSGYILNLFIYRFRIIVNVVVNGEEIHTKTLAIKQDELKTILKNA